MKYTIFTITLFLSVAPVFAKDNKRSTASVKDFAAVSSMIAPCDGLQSSAGPGSYEKSETYGGSMERLYIKKGYKLVAVVKLEKYKSDEDEKQEFCSFIFSKK